MRIGGLLTSTLLTTVLVAGSTAADVRIKVRDEAIVAQGSFTSNRTWGMFQFPLLATADDGTVRATFSAQKDSVHSDQLGKPVFRYDPQSNTWSRAPQADEGLFGAVTLPDGDRLLSRYVVGIDARRLQLPKKGSVAANWRGIVHYDAQALAAQQSQWWIFARQRKGETTWTEERPPVRMPGESRCVREGLLMYPRFLHMLAVPGQTPASNAALAGVTMDRRFTDAACTNLQPFNPIQVLESTDDGKSWSWVGEIPFQPDATADPNWQKVRMGFSEPWLNVMPDQSWVCAIRSTLDRSIGPLYLARSVDRGRTWSQPVVLADHGVKPKLLTLRNGVTVLSYGRPGVSLLVTRDPSGRQWQEPYAVLPDVGGDDRDHSCGYTSLCPLGDNEFMIVYSDFDRKDAAGQRCKTIVSKRIIVE